jgi:glycine/D-amino acid oxidase-like deaminating enzyme
MKNIAIIGAGFSGLAVAWHLFQRNWKIQLTIFDSEPIGTTASGIAAGLLHPFAGAHAKRNWRADEGIAASKELFIVAEKALKRPIVSQCGLLRIALSQAQQDDYSLCQKKYSDQVHWLTEQECKMAVVGIRPFPGIFIDQGMVIDSKAYLEGLWKAVSDRGAKWIQTKISSLSELKEFDTLIVTAGAATTALPELKTIPIRQIKGQLLEFEWPKEIPPLPYPVNSKSYLLMSPGNKSCIAGATFEKEFSGAEVEKEKALYEILPKVQEFFPHLNASHLIECRAALRATTANHLPLLIQATNNCWVLTGMGSKGLLYHALYAKELSLRIFSENAI